MEPAGEFRISLTVSDFQKSVDFYRDVLGLRLEQDWTTAHGRCILLSIERATLEIIDQNQASYIDSVEVGRRVSAQVRFAFQTENLSSAIASANAKGAELVHGPVETPWKDLNARLVGPDGMQMTFFQTNA